MDTVKLKEVINHRISLELNDDFELTKCWTMERDLLASDIAGAIEFLANCSEEEFFWLAEVFEDLIEKTQSKELYQAMVIRNESLENQEYKESNKADLQYALNALLDK